MIKVKERDMVEKIGDVESTDLIFMFQSSTVLVFS